MSRRWNDAAHSKSPQPNGTAVTVPRPFLPPSYYAAAGGIPYPRKQTNTPSSESWTHEQERKAGNRTQRPRHHPSESSIESRNREPLRHVSGPSASSSANSNAPSTRRQGLPNLETDLLPSLQSTVHRMTRPPSRLAEDEMDHYEANQAPKKASNHSMKASSSSRDAHTVKHQDASRSRIPQKSALKSALRSPAPKPSPSAGEPQPSSFQQANSPHRNSLRSVKSLLSRKLGNPSTPNASPAQPFSPQLRSTEPLVQSPSHLPRPKIRDHKYSTPQTPTLVSTSTDESDIESQYQRQWMQRRRLTVTNPEVVPSESSSGSSMDSSFDGLQTPKLGHYSQQRQEWINHPNSFHISSSTVPNSPLMPNIDFREERDKAKILRFSLPPSNSDASLYSNHQLSYPGSWGDSDYRSERDASNHNVTFNAQPGASWEADFSSSEGEDYHRSHTKPRPRSREGRSNQLRPQTHRTPPYDHRRPLETNYGRPPSHRMKSATAPPDADRTHEWFDESSGEHNQENEFDYIPSQPQRRAPVPPGFSAPSLSQEVKRRAAEHRQAFGLPPSDSDDDAQRWSQSDSHRSSVASSRWDWNTRGPEEERDGERRASRAGLSAGAQNMMNKIHPEWNRVGLFLFFCHFNQ